MKTLSQLLFYFDTMFFNVFSYYNDEIITLRHEIDFNDISSIFVGHGTII